MKPFIAKDTGKPLVVLGGYEIGEGGGIIRRQIQQPASQDHGCDPLGNGKFKMVPSGDIVDTDEANRRLGR